MMHQYIFDLLSGYKLETINDYENALKEISQQVVLTGLWRTDFFNDCAFYGGTALRIFFGLQRFSEDLDFTLIRKSDNFSLRKYFSAIADELRAMGFETEISKKKKISASKIESAFVKANTLTHIIKIGAPAEVTDRIHMEKQIKIKLEVDTHPPLPIETETKFLLQPIPCSIRLVRQDYIFAGKIHALLYRKWSKRVKGRDWYDFVWFVKNHTPLNLEHLKNRMIQTNDWNTSDKLTSGECIPLLNEAIDNLEIDQARADISPFVRDRSEIDIWSKEFFRDLINRIHFQN